MYLRIKTYKKSFLNRFIYLYIDREEREREKNTLQLNRKKRRAFF